MNLEKIIFLADEQSLENVVGGGEKVVSSDPCVNNVLKFYANLLPFVSTKHVKITYDVGPWSGNEKTQSRSIIQEATQSDMRWGELTTREKVGVSVSALGVGAVGAIGIGSLISSKFLKSNSPKPTV